MEEFAEIRNAQNLGRYMYCIDRLIVGMKKSFHEKTSFRAYHVFDSMQTKRSFPNCVIVSTAVLTEWQ